MASNRKQQYRGTTQVTEPTDTTAQDTGTTGEAVVQTTDDAAASVDQSANIAVTETQPEATQAPEATEAPVVTPEPTQAPEPEPTQEPVAVATYGDDAISRLQERLDGQLCKSEQIVRDTLNTYLEELSPGRPVQSDAINRNQLMLWRLILRVIETADDVEFEKAYTLLVAYFRVHRKGALGEYHVFRGMDVLTLDQDTTAAFQRALNLLIISATTSGPKEVGRHADLGRSLPEGVYSDNARNRLLGFLS